MRPVLELSAHSGLDLSVAMSNTKDQVILVDFRGLTSEDTQEAFLKACLRLGSLRDQTGRGDFVRVVEHRSHTMPSDIVRYSDTASGGDFHTDGPTVSGGLPAFVGLCCVNAAKSGGETVLIDANRVYGNLSEESKGRLQRLYAFDPRQGSASRPSMRRVLVVHDEQFVRFCYLRSYLESAQALAEVEPLSSSDLEAFDELDREMERLDAQEEIALTWGLAIFFANDRYLHGRRQFEDWAEETGKPARRLLRVWMGHQRMWDDAAESE